MLRHVRLRRHLLLITLLQRNVLLRYALPLRHLCHRRRLSQDLCPCGLVYHVRRHVRWHVWSHVRQQVRRLWLCPLVGHCRRTLRRRHVE